MCKLEKNGNLKKVQTLNKILLKNPNDKQISLNDELN